MRNNSVWKRAFGLTRTVVEDVGFDDDADAVGIEDAEFHCVVMDGGSVAPLAEKTEPFVDRPVRVAEENRFFGSSHGPGGPAGNRHEIVGPDREGQARLENDFRTPLQTGQDQTFRGPVGTGFQSGWVVPQGRAKSRHRPVAVQRIDVLQANPEVRVGLSRAREDVDGLARPFVGIGKDWRRQALSILVDRR